MELLEQFRRDCMLRQGRREFAKLGVLKSALINPGREGARGYARILNGRWSMDGAGQTVQ